jgi:predicted glycosyltransferase
MRQEKYDRLKKMYDSKHMEDVCADAVEAVRSEKKIKELSKEIADTQQRLIDMIGGFDSEASSLLEDLLDLYNQRESKLFEAIYILGACDAETYL